MGLTCAVLVRYPLVQVAIVVAGCEPTANRHHDEPNRQ